MKVQETFVNATQHAVFGESEPHETYTDDVKRLFRDMQQEYGRCVSSMYIDREGQKPVRCGWVFVKKMRYEDSRGRGPDDFYIREVWVQLLDRFEEQAPIREVHDLDKSA